MAPFKLMAKVRIAWWLKPYLLGVACMCWLTGRSPDTDKVERVALKACKITVVTELAKAR
jgi:hypothetical protein